MGNTKKKQKYRKINTKTFNWENRKLEKLETEKHRKN